MSNRKSLGSSPFDIGTSTSGSMGFIPDIGAGKAEKSAGNKKEDQQGCERNRPDTSKKDKKPPTTTIEKKTVSYYLETRLISKIKAVARDKEICYSAVISKVLNDWLAKKGSG